MAAYEYECQKCSKTFTVELSFHDYDKHKRVKCPKCGSTVTRQLVAAVHVQTTKKS